MLLTPHTFVGIAIAASIPNPYVAVPVAFGMHFIGDLIPHWEFTLFLDKDRKIVDPMFSLKAMVDLTLGIAVGMFFTLRALWVLHNPLLATSIFLCGIAAVIPDAIMAPYTFNNNTRGIPKFMYKVQHIIHNTTGLPWGLITQIIVVAFCLVLTLSSTMR